MAKLNEKQLEEVQSLEKKLGKTVIAFSCKDLNATQLKDGELAQIKEAEKKLGLSLVAVK
jgi:hypothetical protein